MADRCYSTVVCAQRDKDIFEKMGYRLEGSEAMSADGNEIPGAIVMVDEEANEGNYDELTALSGIPSWCVMVRVQVLSVTTSLFRMACSGTTAKPCMRATIPLYEWKSGAWSVIQRLTTQGNTGRCIHPLWQRFRELPWGGYARQ